MKLKMSASSAKDFSRPLPNPWPVFSVTRSNAKAEWGAVLDVDVGDVVVDFGAVDVGVVDVDLVDVGAVDVGVVDDSSISTLDISLAVYFVSFLIFCFLSAAKRVCKAAINLKECMGTTRSSVEDVKQRIEGRSFTEKPRSSSLSSFSSSSLFFTSSSSSV